MTFRKALGQVHLWLGFASGLVVLMVSITGCLYAFQAEIQELTGGFRHVEKRETAFLPPSELRVIAGKQLPGKFIHSVQYEGDNRAAVATFYHAEPEYYYQVFMNPYDGVVLAVKNMQRDFFYQVLQGHYYLWLPPAIGQPIVATATLVFVVMLVTGLMLWWPKRNRVRQRFTIKWKAGWRRKNYDLHSVVGFYVLWIAMLLALTGLVWGFEWFGQGVYRLAGGNKESVYLEPLSGKPYAVRKSHPEDFLWLRTKNENPGADLLEIHFPENDSSSIAVTINNDRSMYWRSDYRFFDQYTLREIPVNQVYGKLSQASAADKLIRMNYDIHTGGILGLPGKIIAFLASLTCATLPVTGFMIWWGRRRKETTFAKQASRRMALQTN